MAAPAPPAAPGTPAKLQVNIQDTTKPGPGAEPKPDSAPLTPEPSPSKKRPELRPQVRTPKHSDKLKEPIKETPTKPRDNTVQNRGGPRKAWDSKRPAGREAGRDGREAARGPEARDKRTTRPARRDSWDRQKKDQDKPQRSAYNSEDRVGDKPLVPVHPLQGTWMFWLSLPQGVAARTDRKNRWESTLKELGSNFNSVEHFWSYVHHMELPSRMEYNSSYYLFKSGIKPMWEHEDNMGGGKWVVQLKAPNHVDEVWQNVMLAVVGEAFDAAGDAITGAVVNRRRAGDRVAVWLRKSSEELIAELGEKIKAAAIDGLEVDVTCTYSIHNAEPATPIAE